MELWNTLSEYLKIFKSTGCSYSDYWTLYSNIKKHKKKEILECTSGVSIIVMAHAVMENESVQNLESHITTMESIESRHTTALNAIPDRLKKYINFGNCKGLKIVIHYFVESFIRMCPKGRMILYLLMLQIFSHVTPSHGMSSFDFDYINVVRKPRNPVFGIIDKRYGISYVFQKIFEVD